MRAPHGSTGARAALGPDRDRARARWLARFEPPPRHAHLGRYVQKEDLALANHLSGQTKLYLQLRFRSTRELMDVRRVVLPAVQKNRLKKDAAAAYADDGGDFLAGGAAGASTSSSADGWLNRLADIREYDVQVSSTGGAAPPPTAAPTAPPPLPRSPASHALPPSSRAPCYRPRRRPARRRAPSAACPIPLALAARPTY